MQAVIAAADIRRDALVLPNRKNPARPVKTVFLAAVDPGTRVRVPPGELLLWQKQQGLRDDEPLFCSRQRGSGGERQAISREEAWKVVKGASARAPVQALALRPSRYGDAGQPAPVHPHRFRHARVRQLVRQTKRLPLAQKQAGWRRLQMASRTIGDEEARQRMRGVTECGRAALERLGGSMPPHQGVASGTFRHPRLPRRRSE